jgi:hypothetical protein
MWDEQPKTGTNGRAGGAQVIGRLSREEVATLPPSGMSKPPREEVATFATALKKLENVDV